jgi:hypothetical protein
MERHRVRVFSCGSYINRGVMAEVGLRPTSWETASLAGFDISIRPLANLVPSDRHRVFGILATATHHELDILYAHAQHVLGGTYLPEAILAESADGARWPALCYLASAMDPDTPTDNYLDRIIEPAKAYRFPDWYVDRLQEFRP